MEIQKKLITPAKAVELLQSNVKNRRAKNPVVLRYAKDMLNGKWKEDTFELIKISKSGVILDGQHRLMAVVKSNVNVYFHVVEGLDDSIFDVLDTGSTRNAGDVFKINQVKYATTIPAIISFYDVLKENRKGRSSQVNNKKTNAELLIEYNLNPIFWDNIARDSHTLYSQFGKILSTAFIGGFLAFFSDINKEDAIEFMNQLCSGKNVENDSINYLRMKLVNEKVSVHKLQNTTKQAYVIKCWNAFRSKQNYKILKYTPSTDSMPKAI
jgi:hypothetical protein